MSYEYKGYNPDNSKHVQKYISRHYNRVTVNFKRDEFNATIQPLLDRYNISIQDFIRQAVQHEVERLSD